MLHEYDKCVQMLNKHEYDKGVQMVNKHEYDKGVQMLNKLHGVQIWQRCKWIKKNCEISHTLCLWLKLGINSEDVTEFIKYHSVS